VAHVFFSSSSEFEEEEFEESEEESEFSSESLKLLQNRDHQDWH